MTSRIRRGASSILDARLMQAIATIWKRSSMFEKRPYRVYNILRHFKRFENKADLIHALAITRLIIWLFYVLEETFPKLILMST